MNALLQISDLHFGTDRPEVTGALLALSRAVQPDMVVVSGDITQRGRRSQFGAARAFIDQLAPRALLTLPGNHDIPLFNPLLRVFFPYANYAREFGANLEPVFESETLLVVGVNTTRRWRHVDGEVSVLQVEGAAQKLRRATPRQLRIVVTHQPVHVIREQDRENLLHGHEFAVRTWSEAGADIVMGGHIHLPYVSAISDREGELRRRIWAVQAGTALSTRVRRGAPNSVNILRYDSLLSRCAVERWDFHSASAAFEIADATELDLDRSIVSRSSALPNLHSNDVVGSRSRGLL